MNTSARPLCSAPTLQHHPTPHPHNPVMPAAVQVGRYPVHFHMAARVPAGTYLRSCAIHDSLFRAVTLHGTQASEPCLWILRARE